MGHDELCKAFYNGLYDKENMTKEEFIEYNFKCCGIFVPGEDDYPGLDTQLIPEYENYFGMGYHPLKYISHEIYKKLNIDIFINIVVYVVNTLEEIVLYILNHVIYY